MYKEKTTGKKDIIKETKGVAKREGNTKTQQSIEHQIRCKTREDKGKNM